MRPSIVTFLTTVLDAEAARQRDPFNQWHTRDCDAVPDVLYPDRETGACDCGVPEQVLADIEAKQELLKLHSAVILRGGAGARYFDTTAVCSSCEPPQLAEHAFPCKTLRRLAQPYAGRPGYEESWRP